MNVITWWQRCYKSCIIFCSKKQWRGDSLLLPATAGACATWRDHAWQPFTAAGQRYKKEISVSSSHIHRRIRQVHYVLYRWLPLMDIVCTCACAVCMCLFILFFFLILSRIFIFNQFFLRYDIQVFPITICSDFYLHEPCNTEMTMNPFGISTLLCIIAEVVQKLFHSSFSRKIEHDWFWFLQWFMYR